MAAFSAVSAAGGVIAAMSTITGFLTVAGGVLAGVGALTGKKDLVKLGSLMSLGGAIGNALGGAAEAASATGGGADLDAIVAEQGASGATSGVSGAAAGGAADAASGVPMTPGSLGGQDLAGQIAGPGGLPMQGAPGAQSGVAQTSSLADKAMGSVPTAPGALAGDVASAAPDALSEAGQGLTFKDIQAWADKAKQAAGGVGDFMKNNPALVKVGGDVLTGMYGPEAEQADLLRQQNEQQQAWANRARANLNAPIALRYRTGGT